MPWTGLYLHSLFAGIDQTTTRKPFPPSAFVSSQVWFETSWIGGTLAVDGGEEGCSGGKLPDFSKKSTAYSPVSLVLLRVLLGGRLELRLFSLVHLVGSSGGVSKGILADTSISAARFKYPCPAIQFVEYATQRSTLRVTKGKF